MWSSGWQSWHIRMTWRALQFFDATAVHETNSITISGLRARRQGYLDQHKWLNLSMCGSGEWGQVPRRGQAGSPCAYDFGGWTWWGSAGIRSGARERVAGPSTGRNWGFRAVFYWRLYLSVYGGTGPVPRGLNDSILKQTPSLLSNRKADSVRAPVTLPECP